MKQFRKNEKNLFICEECGRTFVKKECLSKHAKLIHVSIKNYFDKWLKDNDDDICRTCGKETNFMGLKGYRDYCSVKCMVNNITIQKNTKQTKKERYGDENYHNIEKMKQTNKERYGVEIVFQSEDIKEKTKQTLQEKYGVNNPYLIKNTREKALKLAHSPEVDKKRKETFMKKYGVENPYQSEEIKEKIKQTFFKKYGVEYNTQNIDIFEKGQKTRFLRKQFRDTDLWYQGSYELDFLEKHYDIYPEIQRAPSIKFKFNGKNKVYHPDFYIPSLNLIIEIKSSYFYNRFLELNKAKEQATLQQYKYKLILDKNGSI